MPDYPVRRAQLITTFGPGAMMVTRDGISIICAGLDHWFKREPGDDGPVDLSEFRIEEWRLQEELKVGHFRLPPDYRATWQYEEVPPNCDITVPFLRFPQWHHCPRCHRLAPEPLETRGVLRCDQCKSRHNKDVDLVQVRFVAICDHGHLQDFPWREWAHGKADTTCRGTLRLVAMGGTTLSSQVVKCDACGKSRNLAGITTTMRKDDTTALTDRLEAGGEFKCQGKRPWLGLDEGTDCDRPLRGALRSASNVWYAQVRSAIYLPQGEDPVIEEIRSVLRKPPFSTAIKWAGKMGRKLEPADLRGEDQEDDDGQLLLRGFPDKDIQTALDTLDRKPSLPSGATDVPEDDPETRFRRAEHAALRNSRDEGELRVRPMDLGRYEPIVARHFSRLTLVERLRETRALAGLTRVLPENELTIEDRKALLWRDSHKRRSWLPAYVVRGEGFYLELNEARYAEWMRDHGTRILERTTPVTERAANARLERKLPPRPIGPRHILLHTLSHLLINQLVFECGYSAASLGERLYVSESTTAPMAGLLIYTAAGDSEGTLGGLVRMAREQDFEMILRRAIEGARWCSADPVCMEMGRFGQGPLSTNLAACHSCSLLPETACEEFNQFLDRGLLVGDLLDGDLAYFQF